MPLFSVAHGCPNCRGEEDDALLVKGRPCAQCLPEEEGEICAALARRKRLQGLKPYCTVQEKLFQTEVLFEKALGFSPSSLQRSWLKRLFWGDSFAIVAPTGTGKTTFGLLATLLFSPRALVLVPTKLLVQQIGTRLNELMQRAGLDRKILAYQGRKREKTRLEEGDFDILVATTAFFYRHAEDLSTKDFKIVFIDDVDAFLKRSTQVDRLFKLLGFSEEEVALALKPRKSEEDFARLEEIRRRHGGKTILLMSSATLKPRTNRVLLFRYLLGFEIHRASPSIRRVIDAATEELPWAGLLEKAADLIKTLGTGGLLFLAPTYGRERVEEVVQFLRDQGLKVLSYLEASASALMQEMERGDFHVAVGLAHPTNPLVRGIDLPYILRYALFLGVPRHEFSVRLSLAPAHLHQVLAAIVPLLDEEERLKALGELQYLKRSLSLKEEALERYPRIKTRLQEIKTFLEDKFSDQGFLARLEASEEVALKRKDGELFLVLGDTTSYLQASGRVSRLTVHGLLPGLAVVLTDDRRALRSLERRLRFFLGEDFAFRPLEDLSLAKISKELTHARQVRSEPLSRTELAKTTLLVVESPHKARTIALFWGKPASRKVGEALVYEIPVEGRVLLVTASLGHVFNLSRCRGFFGVYVQENGFLPVFDTIKICLPRGEQLVDPEEVERRCPEGPLRDKQDLLDALRRVAFEVDEVLIGSDPDAEGEKIAYDLLVSLRPFNAQIRRLEFHEVTPRALQAALASPQDFNLNRVKAQLARRVVDRWVGFVLSRKLWQAFGRRRLSAGRVQTPVLGWVIERAEEAKEKKARLRFVLGGHPFLLELEDLDLAKRLEKELPSLRWKITETREEERSPLPPYTTDTILEDAHHRLGFSARQTMELLQELFEAGLITYHRTDSTRVSEQGRYQVARPYIQAHLGEEFFYPRSWGEGGAHEAIRPTRPRSEKEWQGLVATGMLVLEHPRRALRLYDLIFRRFMASQTRAARVRVGRLLFQLPSYQWTEDLVLEVILEGFEKFWPTFKVVSLGASAQVQEVSLRVVPKVELYTEGSLVQEMKRRGLGRPSTYAEIVGTLIERRYVKVLPGGRLYPTRLGRAVYTYLKTHYPRQVDETLTRYLEHAMDQIEEGKLDHQAILQETYAEIHPLAEGL